MRSSAHNVMNYVVYSAIASISRISSNANQQLLSKEETQQSWFKIFFARFNTPEIHPQQQRVNVQIFMRLK